MRLLITDLDNTLYDWVTFYAHAFTAMVRQLTALFEIPEHQLLSEFKEVHQRYGTSEPPYALLELPSVRLALKRVPEREWLHVLDPALHAFNRERRDRLHLYPGVQSTLAELRNRGLRIVGHTEAIAVNACFRLAKLGIASDLARLYAAENKYPAHLSGKPPWEPPQDVRLLPAAKRKPDPEVLREICNAEHVEPAQAYYVGDSLGKDIAMARAAGVTAIWSRYGTIYERHLWDTLVRITHWTPVDVEREERLRQVGKDVTPDYVIDSFEDLLTIPGLTVHPELQPAKICKTSD